MVRNCLGSGASHVARNRSHCEMASKAQSNSRLLSDAYASALLRRASFSAPKPGR
jgi:hypothetical protein